MLVFSLFFTLGVWLLQQQAQLPDLRPAWLLLPAATLLLLPCRTPWQGKLHHAWLALLACALGFFYAAGFAQQRLGDALPAAWQGKDIQVVGVVAELPAQHERGLRFAFDVERVLTPAAQVPHHILLATYDAEKDAPLALHAGERWQLAVRLKIPHGSANPYGFDFEAWMLERRLRASGYVQAKGGNVLLDARVDKPGYLIERMREHIRTHFHNVLGDAPYAGVLAALAIGDQGSIPDAQWQVFTRTGVNHLMSISGLHITMLAAIAFALMQGGWRRSPRLSLRLPARQAAALAGLLTALAYTLLSGYSVPAQRTLYMLATVACALFLSRSITVSQILAAALLVVLLLDPWAVLSPGFWLSFGAVALIFYVSANRIGQPHWLLSYGRVQWAMMLGMIPPLLALFQQVSLVSPVANAFAIPLVSFIVVPLSLLGALPHMQWSLWLAHHAMALCMIPLTWLNALPDAVWTQHAPPPWSIALGLIGALWCLLPRGFPARWLGLLLLLPLFLLAPTTPLPGALRLFIFDVGQGLAVAVQTQTHALLYDTGPDFAGEADSGNRILVPALRAQGIARLDSLMLTHDDSDHTGGARSILQAMPVDAASSSLADGHALLQVMPHNVRCADGQSWVWDGVNFEVLHPGRESYAQEKVRDNDRGCVLRISSGTHSILLTADIEKGSEARLLRLHADKLPATLLVVPHHGSKTSSTEAFVQAVHPRYAVFTVGYRNRYGHPKDEVVERYRAIGSEVLRSDEDGAVLVDMDAQAISVSATRRTRVRYWQTTPAAG